MRKMALIIFPVILLLSACALEIANVIGPGGGYVFYDKGNYNDKWRYIECSPFDFSIDKQKDESLDESLIEAAVRACIKESGGYYTFSWEIPNEAQMAKLLECFSYGFTRFSPDYYYLAANKTSHYDHSDPNSWNPSTWEVVVLHKNFEKALNGEVEKVSPLDKDGNPIKDSKGKPIVIRVRPIRKF